MNDLSGGMENKNTAISVLGIEKERSIPRLSIVMPVYNNEKFLKISVDSVLAQVFTDFELILVDDGSQDDSGKICDGYESGDNRIKVIHKCNEGAGAARNAGIAEAKGDYIAFPDSDDYILPEMYKDLMDAADKYHPDIVYSGIKKVHYDKCARTALEYDMAYPFMHFTSREQCREGILKLKPRTTLFDSPCNKIYNLTVVRANNLRFPAIRRLEDAYFNLMFHDYAESVVTIPNIYYHYRKSSQSYDNHKFTRNYIDYVMTYFYKAEELTKQWRLFNDEITVYFDSQLIRNVWIALDFCMNRNWEMKKCEKTAYIEGIMNIDYIRQKLMKAQVAEDIRDELMLLKKGSSKRILKKVTINHYRRSVTGFFARTFFNNQIRTFVKRTFILNKLAAVIRPVIKKINYK